MPNPAATDKISGFDEYVVDPEHVLNDLSFFDSDAPLKSRKFDPVHKPKHYNRHNSIECVEAIEACTESLFSGYLQGNAMKYLWRYRYKDNPLQYLGKSKWYLNKLIETVAKEKK